jgi:hypothetical protein
MDAPPPVRPVVHGAHQRADLYDEVTLSAPELAEFHLRPCCLACFAHRVSIRVPRVEAPGGLGRSGRRVGGASAVRRHGCLEEHSHGHTIGELKRSGIVRPCPELKAASVVNAMPTAVWALRRSEAAMRRLCDPDPEGATPTPGLIPSRGLRSVAARDAREGVVAQRGRVARGVIIEWH